MGDYTLLLSSILLGINGQFLLKKGVLASEFSPNIIEIIKTLFNPLVFLGFLSYGLSSIVWLFVLQKFELSVAYPSLAVSYVVIVILSVLFFDEPFTLFKVIGVALIITGVYLLFK